MAIAEHILFDELKKEVAEVYRKTYPSCQLAIEDWKGQDITNFQEELIANVKGRISEKWFYTHIKSKCEKLPRIDMLNMLSQYAGYQDWRDFTRSISDFTIEDEVIAKETPSEASAINSSCDRGCNRTKNDCRKPTVLQCCIRNKDKRTYC